ncbi:oligosaccharide flippase family protein [Megasphaera sueciensis]|uniref:oligosaccharide flippase family protein n=1 Tax=Megasphaera sueciensis TaxID=349094 RepID=UPI003CFE2B93
MASISKNYFYNMIFQVYSLILPIITIPYLSRVIGAEGLGKYAFALSVVTYFTMIAFLGMNNYGQRTIAYVRNQDIYTLSATFWGLFIVKLVLSTIVLFMYLVFIFFCFSNIFLYVILAMEIVTVSCNVDWFFQGIENFRVLAVRNIFIRTLATISIFLFVKTSNDFVIYVLCMTFADFLSTASMLPLLTTYICKVHFIDIHCWKHVVGSFRLFIPQIAMTIYLVMDKTILGVLSNSPMEVGFYDQAHKLVLVLLTIVTSLGTVMSPQISFLYANKNYEGILRNLRYSFHIVGCLAIPMIFGIFLVANIFVPFFFGNGFDQVIPLLKIFSFLLLAIGLSNILGSQYLIPIGREHLLTISVTIGAIINVFFNIVLIPAYASLGSTIASVIAEIGVFGYQFWVTRKELPFRQYFLSMKNYIFAGAIMFFILYFIPQNIPTVLYLLISIFSGIVIYIMVLILLKDKFIIEVISRIKRILVNS